jgi:hypothetical protein
MAIIEQDLGGYFKWVRVNDDLVLVDPQYYDEYMSQELTPCTY